MGDTPSDTRSTPGAQYALQIRTNSGGPGEYWAFDDEFGVRTDQDLAWADVAEAEEMGYRRDDLRVVVIWELVPQR